MKLSIKNVQRNWVLRNQAEIEKILIEAYAAKKQTRNPQTPLYLQISDCFSIDNLDVPDNELNYLAFAQIKAAIDRLPAGSQNPCINRLKALLAPKALPIAITQEEKQETEDEATEGTELRAKEKEKERAEAKKSVYQKGFDYFAKKRELAKQNGLAWLLRKQLEQLKAMRKTAARGKKWTWIYAIGVGISIAGYWTLTIGLGTIMATPAWVIVPLVAVPFSGLLNFWVSRKEPTEFMFDQYEREDTEDLPQWKRIVSGIFGGLNSLLLTGLLAFGIWEVMGAFELTSVATMGLPLVLGVGMGIPLVLGAIYFIPELSLGVKFNREWMQINPWARFKSLLQDVAKAANQDLSIGWQWFGNQLKNLVTPGAQVDQAFKAGATFVALLGCVLVGAVFTALAVGDLVANIMPFEAAVTVLMVVAMTGIAFYASKADTEVRRRFVSTEAEKELSWREVIVRAGNALNNGVPAFLGGVVALGVDIVMLGGGGLGAGLLTKVICLAIFTGVCGTVTSYLSGAEGEQKGYEGAIDDEITATETALNEVQASGLESPEPTLYDNNDKLVPVTQFPMLFKGPFYRDEDTNAAEDAIMTAAPSLPSLK